MEVYNQFINYFYTYKIYSHLNKDGISSKNQILSFALKRKISTGMWERSKNNDKRGEEFEA